MKDYFKIYLICPECGGCNWQRCEGTEAEDFGFKCATCGELASPEFMCAKTDDKMEV